jgi:hypothetical protein
MDERLFTTREAANIVKDRFNVKVSPGTLEVYRCQGKGPRYRKIGRRAFYCESDLKEFYFDNAQVVETVDSVRV